MEKYKTYTETMNDERLMKKPLYKVGDIIVYPDRYNNSMKETPLEIYQPKIIFSYGIIEIYDGEDHIEWGYRTEETEENKTDTLWEEDILYKL